MLLTVTVKAASPEEEASFLKVIDDAFTKQNVDAIATNICWDNTYAAWKNDKASLRNYFSLDDNNSLPCSAMYVDAIAVPPIITNRVYNLPAIKYIQIMDGSKEAMLDGQISYQYLAVGEKDGKLMIAMRFKQHE